MATLLELRRQIESAQDLHSIVRSMKAMAAASIWQYERAVSTINEYERTIEFGLQIVLRARKEAIEIQSVELRQPLGAVIFGSEQGMVGNFNGQIVGHALDVMAGRQVSSADRSIIAVGRRARSRLEQAKQPVALSLRMPTSVDSIRPAIRELMVEIEQWREQENLEHIILFHNAPISGTQYEAQSVQLVPLNLAWLQGLRDKPWISDSLPTFDLDLEMFFAELIQEYIYLTVFRAFAASLSAENASRLSSMEAAESNIEERLEHLNNRYHQARQTAITSELQDIVSGFEVAGDAME